MITKIDHQKILSVVVPCFNEQDGLEEIHDRLIRALETIGLTLQIIYVDDGSTDDTAGRLRELQAEDDRVQVVLLTRNFGHQLAITAGMDSSCGDAIVLVDADLQDPPELIPQMVALWKDGYDVVYGERIERSGESPFKLLTAKWFYRLLNWLSDTKIPCEVGDFRLMDRKVVDALREMPESDRFLRGMISWVGFRQWALPYKRDQRFSGTSKYTFWKMLGLANNGVLSFSLAPLRLSLVAGLLTLVGSVLGAACGWLMPLWNTTVHISWWWFLSCAIVFLGSIQLISIGILGEYVGRIYRETKRRPLYLVREQLGQRPRAVVPRPWSAEVA